jgi:hypothetical protein
MATPNPRKPSPVGKAAKPAGPKKAPKAGSRSSPSAKPPKPTSFMNWLGRQVGHVKKAIKTDVTPAPAKPAAKAARPTASPAPTPGPAPSAATDAAASKVVYRNDKIEEVEHPTQPGVILRRTIVDEVIVEGEVVEKKGDE